MSSFKIYSDKNSHKFLDDFSLDTGSEVLKFFFNEEGILCVEIEKEGKIKTYIVKNGEII